MEQRSETGYGESVFARRSEALCPSWRARAVAVLVTAARVVAWPMLLLLAFLVLLVATNGSAGGAAACAGAIAATVVIAVVVRRRATKAGERRTRTARWGPVVTTCMAAALAVSVCVPTVPVQRRLPPDVSAGLGGRSATWRLPSGSSVAVYHYPPTPGSTRQPAPLVYLHGGPIRSIPLIDHRFMAGFASLGYDVWLYEQPGAGRSGLLDGTSYGIERELTDLDAVLDGLNAGPVDVIGFSAGGSLLAQALADPSIAPRIRRAVFADPGPMDGPTAARQGPAGRSTARGLAPASEARRATVTPRYATALGLMMTGALPQDNGLVGQAEMLNAFTNGDLGATTASAYCAEDADRIPVEDVPGGFDFNAAGSLRVQQTIRESPSIDAGLRRSATPAMVLVAECSSQDRSWAQAVVDALPTAERVHVLPGVGHHMWNGLDDNDARARAVITAYLQDRPSPLPSRADLLDR